MGKGNFRAVGPPDGVTLRVGEDHKPLDVAPYSGTAQQRKALIRKLVKELRVMGRDEIVPTYRVPALVRAPGDQVELPGIEPGSLDPSIGLLRA